MYNRPSIVQPQPGGSRALRRAVRLALLALLLAILALLSTRPLDAQARHNVILFVADGLRAGSVTAENAPAMARLKQEGVDFANSHSLYPTVTTANASAIAAGHHLGDTGGFGNTLYFGFPV
jgi:predicted AlkP superfamily pyrophosphatase or phosphodiesterase